MEEAVEPVGPWLKAKSNEVAIETLELAHEQLEVEFERQNPARFGG